MVFQCFCFFLCAVKRLQDKETKAKVVQGDYGTGKDYLALSNFLQMVEKGNYEKIIWIRNNIEAEGTKPIGFLPGSLTEKLSVYAEIVGDFVGDKVGFEMLLNSGKLELVHAGFLRGRDLRNSIIYCTEAQNMPSSLVKLILSRISEGSIAFFNGDTKQIDDRSFKSNNGMNLMIEKLSGNPLFGYVKLETCERSEVAKLVKLLD
jgi:PhoH-like ATPase